MHASRASSLRKQPTGFTLIELMITIGIVGILASLGLPTFKRYKARAYTAEAHTHLGSLVTGIKTYYSLDHWSQGVVASGTPTKSTNCLPRTSFTTNAPDTGTKTVLDWENESASFKAIGFAPPEPLLFHYRMGTATVPMPGGPGFFTGNSTQNGGTCGLTANNSNVYHVEASISPDGSKYHFMRWRLCSNADNVLFMCERAQNDFECSVRAVGTPGDARGGWILILVGLCTVARRNRRATAGRN